MQRGPAEVERQRPVGHAELQRKQHDHPCRRVERHTVPGAEHEQRDAEAAHRRCDPDARHRAACEQPVMQQIEQTDKQVQDG